MNCAACRKPRSLKQNIARLWPFFSATISCGVCLDVVDGDIDDHPANEDGAGSVENGDGPGGDDGAGGNDGAGADDGAGGDDN